jgi:hypothetical protein
MSVKFAEPDTETEIVHLPARNVLTFETRDIAAWTSDGTMPGIDAEEYELLYRPTMLGVYTARHQRMPKSERALREHVFGCAGDTGCEECRMETEFLIAHQKKFF